MQAAGRVGRGLRWALAGPRCHALRDQGGQPAFLAPLYLRASARVGWGVFRIVFHGSALNGAGI